MHCFILVYLFYRPINCRWPGRYLKSCSKGESAFKYEAAFYEALSFLKEKDNGTAKDWLEKIPADAPNYKKAQELMKKL